MTPDPDNKPSKAPRAREARAGHFLGLDGAAIVRTPFYALADKAIKDIVKHRAMASFTGPPGTGKSFALDTIGPLAELPVLRIEFDHRATMRSISVQLLRELSREEPKGSKHQLIPQLVDALAAPRLILVDEAQRLNRECLDHIRFLHDHRCTDFALVFAGGDGCWERLGSEPQLRRRIFRPVKFRPLTEHELAKFLPKFHPIWKRVTPDQTSTIFNCFAGGIIGRWAAITVTLADCFAADDRRHGSLDGADIDAALLAHGIAPDDLDDATVP